MKVLAIELIVKTWTVNPICSSFLLFPSDFSGVNIRSDGVKNFLFSHDLRDIFL